jgi:hypothetical protein
LALGVVGIYQKNKTNLELGVYVSKTKNSGGRVAFFVFDFKV